MAGATTLREQRSRPLGRSVTDLWCMPLWWRDKKFQPIGQIQHQYCDYLSHFGKQQDRVANLLDATAIRD